MLMLNMETMNVAGRKRAVMKVKVIMAMLSFFEEVAMAVLRALSCWLMTL
jgi:hypothetical protein